MCHWCHKQGHNPGAPSHRSQNCRDPNNSWSTVNQQQTARGGGGKPQCKYGSACYRTCPIHRAKYDHCSGAAAGAVAPVVRPPGDFLWQIKTLSGNNNIHPRDVDASRGAQIWDGSVWWSVWKVLRIGNTVRVIWVVGQHQGAPEQDHDFLL